MNVNDTLRLLCNPDRIFDMIWRDVFSENFVKKSREYYSQLFTYVIVSKIREHQLTSGELEGVYAKSLSISTKTARVRIKNCVDCGYLSLNQSGLDKRIRLVEPTAKLEEKMEEFYRTRLLAIRYIEKSMKDVPEFWGEELPERFRYDVVEELR